MALVIENVRLSAGLHLDNPPETLHPSKVEKDSLNIVQGDLEETFRVAEVPLLPRLEAPLVWTGDDFKSASDYTYTLTNEEVNEIENALEHFKGKPHISEHFCCCNGTLNTHDQQLLVYEEMRSLPQPSHSQPSAPS